MIMGVKRRRSKRKEQLSPSAESWLRGEQTFFQFRPDAELRDIWERYGDKTVMEWPEDASGPCRIYMPGNGNESESPLPCDA